MRIHEILTEAELDEINRRGFLKGLGAAATGAASAPASAGGGLIYGAPIPIHTESDPPLKRTIKLIWNYKGRYESLTDSDKKQIEALIRKEIKDFMGSNTIKQYEDKLIDLISKELKRGKLENDTKDIVIKIFREFYQFMWTQRGYWEPRLKNA